MQTSRRGFFGLVAGAAAAAGVGVKMPTPTTYRFSYRYYPTEMSVPVPVSAETFTRYAEQLGEAARREQDALAMELFADGRR